MMDPGYLRDGIDQALAVVGAMEKDVALCVLAAATRIVEERPDAAKASGGQPVKRRRVRTVATKITIAPTPLPNGGVQ
jgi:hypothetical protein